MHCAWPRSGRRGWPPNPCGGELGRFDQSKRTLGSADRGVGEGELRDIKLYQATGTMTHRLPLTVLAELDPARTVRGSRGGASAIVSAGWY